MRSSGHKTNGRKGVLDAIERLGNALPDPVLLFVGLMAIVMVLSAVAAMLELSAVHPGNGERLLAQSLFRLTICHACWCRCHRPSSVFHRSA